MIVYDNADFAASIFSESISPLKPIKSPPHSDIEVYCCILPQDYAADFPREKGQRLLRHGFSGQTTKNRINQLLIYNINFRYSCIRSFIICYSFVCDTCCWFGYDCRYNKHRPGESLDGVWFIFSWEAA